MDKKQMLYLLDVGDSAAGVPAGAEWWLKVPLDQGQVVTGPQLGLEEEGGAHTAQLAMGDNGDTVTQDVCLVHVVGGEDDSAA